LAKFVAATASIVAATIAQPAFAQTALEMGTLANSIRTAADASESVLLADAIAQTETLTALSVITDMQLNSTPEGLSIVLISEQPLSAEIPQTIGNALIINIPNAALDLGDPDIAQQFSPIEGIAVVQLSNSADGGVEIAITGADAPPVAEIKPAAGTLVTNNLEIGVALGDAINTVDNSDTVDSSESIQLVVTATRTEENIAEVPRSVTVIDREDIERELLFTNNLPDILGRLVPGYGAPTQEDRTTATLRGRPITVLIDGVPQTPNNDGFATSLSTIAPELIERIEVLRGPSAIYGDGGTGGVVNIITRSPSDETIAYNLGVGADLGLTSNEGDRFGYSGQFGVSTADEQGDALISLSYDNAGAQFDANGNRLLPNGVANNERIGLLTKLGYNIDEDQRVEFTYSLFRQIRDTEFTFDNAVAAEPDAEFGRALRIDADYEEPPQQTNYVLNLAYSNEDIGGSELNAQLYYRNTREVGIFTDLRGLNLPSTFPILWQTSLEDTDVGTRVQLDTPLGESASLLWGADYSVNETAAPLLVNDTAALDANNLVTVIDRSLDRFPEYELDSLGLFAQGRWDITDQFQVSGGLRYENVGLSVDDYQLAFSFSPVREREGGSNSFDDVLFNAGLLYSPIPEVGLFANFAQGFSIPNVGSALALVDPGFNVTTSELLLPQKVNNYEIGIRGDFNRVQATLAGFYNESSLGSAIAVDFATNQARVERAPQRNYGVEATVDWQPSDAWRLGGLFSWNEGENDADNDGDFEALSILEIDPIKVGLYLENETVPGWTNRLDALIIGTRDRSVDAGVDLFAGEGYTILDFSSNIQLGDGLLSLGIGNLLNNQYGTIRQQNKFNVTQRAPGLGRTFQLGYSVSF
ncbi:MAG: TonB-dependent receptor, partial [Cyanobacteria bacterium P01_F01_bin.3]